MTDTKTKAVNMSNTVSVDHLDAQSPPQIQYSSVGRRFDGPVGSFQAVTDIELTIERGEFICVIGPSGCGKSTLLNMAAGLLTPSVGDVSYQGKPVREINTDVGYVTQKDSLLPWRTVAGNVALPLELHNVPRSERGDKVSQMLNQVGLSKFAGHYPSQLSGGMRKRVMLAQTWIYEPHTLLMDEPFGALDALLRTNLQTELLARCERDGTTVVFVTHDLEEAILLADRVVVFSAAPGRIIHVEKIELERPRDIMELRTTPEFLDVWKRLWNLLEEQINPVEVR